MRTPETMRRVAQAVVAGGAAGVRAQGLEDIAELRAHLTVPIIGLVKEGEDGVIITPTLDLARASVRAGADIVAIDGTRRARPDGRRGAEATPAAPAAPAGLGGASPTGLPPSTTPGPR